MTYAKGAINYQIQPLAEVAGNGFQGIVYSAMQNGKMAGVGYMLAFNGVSKKRTPSFSTEKLFMMYVQGCEQSRDLKVLSNYNGQNIKIDGASQKLFGIANSSAYQNLESRLDDIKKQHNEVAKQENELRLPARNIKQMKAQAAYHPPVVKGKEAYGIESRVAQQQTQKTYAPINANQKNLTGIVQRTKPELEQSKYKQAYNAMSNYSSKAKSYARKKIGTAKSYAAKALGKTKDYATRSLSKVKDYAKKQAGTLKDKVRRYSASNKPDYSKAKAVQPYKVQAKNDYRRPTPINTWVTGGMHPGNDYAKKAMKRLKPFNHPGYNDLSPNLYTKQDSGYEPKKSKYTVKPEYRHNARPKALPPAQRALPPRPKALPPGQSSFHTIKMPGEKKVKVGMN